ncbi:Phosphoglycerate mutase [Sulfitobacter noctilucicola]|uniref:Phosphohistidine phosphatase n=1 Tax=Sulfitobacter noctilucicola TaxID=1342301 RepID=A0A7W6M6A1_9RHOB|nr:histidine phosphatase family protein [Sulfitobacter noctilucicola]KIN62223.1 Phosphoglycerate mutase [Sulfitobacter noctilucicola]MBB4173263.1 phosphohistidine phosphatase [Sulfitobacter noctilucicola]
MKRLILMRHAKSDWSGGPSSDHDRPLNPRGRKAASALGAWMTSKELMPEQVLCSSAMRTKETFVRLDLGDIANFRYDRALYLAEPDTLLNALQAATGDCVLMIGHNPGSGMMAEAIVQETPNHPQFMSYPTGATLVADFDITDWRDACWGKAVARHFIVPRDL